MSEEEKKVAYIGEAGQDPDNVLRAAIGDYQQVAILGYDKEGNVDFRASTNMTQGVLLWLLESFKVNYLLATDTSYYEDEDEED